MTVLQIPKAAPPVPVKQPLKATIIWPTEEQAEAGVRKLLKCVPVWEATPALLVEKPHVAAIVYVREVSHDARGFRLIVEMEEVLVAPEGMRDKRALELGCVWNQPYMSFDQSQVHAAYCFSLRFEREGVARVRQLWAGLPKATTTPASDLTPFLNLFSLCFMVGGRIGGISEERFQELIRPFTTGSGDPSHEGKA